MGIYKDILHVIASLIAVFGFLFGYDSLPELLGKTADGLDNTTLIDSFNKSIFSALVLIGYPLLSFIDTWFVVSLMKLIVHFLNAIGINLGKVGRYYGGNPNIKLFIIIGLLVHLPIVIGFNAFFVQIVFGGFTDMLPIGLFILSIIVTGVFYTRWIHDWRP